MIIVIARAEFDPATLDAMQVGLDAMMRATWADSGCLSYSMAVENRAEGIVSIVERWATEADLEAHLATAHMAAFKTAIDGSLRSIDATVYIVTGERPLRI